MMSVREMRTLICAHHYLKSVPAGESYYAQHEGAIVVFSRPANNRLGMWLLGSDCAVWELSRMWAPDGHRPNLLTEAISRCTAQFLRAVGGVQACPALVSYADPNAGHLGGIYRAASWQYLGQSEEGRSYVDARGIAVARRSFHSGGRALRKAEIEARGFSERKLPGKHRFARGLTREARRKISSHPNACAWPQTVA